MNSEFKYNYEFIAYCFKDGLSSCRVLWKHIETGKYYISYDFPKSENKMRGIDTSYMLIKGPKDNPSRYIDKLTNEEEVSDKDYRLGYAKYNNTYWKIPNPIPAWESILVNM